MEDCKSVVLEGDDHEHLIAAAQNILKSLEAKKKMREDVRKILAELGDKLTNFTHGEESKDEIVGEGSVDIEKQLNVVHEKIMSRETDRSMMWDGGQEEISEYLNAVKEAQMLTQRLEKTMSSDESSENAKLLGKAHDVLQMSMSRLEDEFKHILRENKLPFEPELMSFRLSEEDVLVDENSCVSFEDDPSTDMLHRDSTSRLSDEYFHELIRSDVIPDLRDIANVMLRSNYEHECSQAYISVRKDALDECLFILEIEKLSIEDVLKMDWGELNLNIKRWIRAIKVFVRLYLASEKRLSEQVFGESGSLSYICFFEASKFSILQLLNFGDAIAIGPHKPEKLFRILDMHEVLADLLPDIGNLFSDESGYSVRKECNDVLMRLGASVHATFVEFEKAIALNRSTHAFAGGGIHHLTRYVMNYIKTLTDYSGTLNVLLKDHEREDCHSSSPDTSSTIEDEQNSESTCETLPMAVHFRSVTSLLEANLEDRSKLYKDSSLQHFFLMNNIHYMAQKVKNSELRTIFGDGWIRKRNWMFQQHAMNYERATWSPVLALLKDDGLHNPGSKSISKTLLRERFRTFNVAFEDVYKAQTAWVVLDLQLREDLRISTSLKVIQAYRTFLGRHTNEISDRYTKYSADDLQTYLLDLFEGSPRSLPSSHRR